MTEYLGRSAVEVLMNVTYELPDKLTGDLLRADQRLYNDFIDYLETTEARWPRQNVSTGQAFVKAVSNALWYLNPHHATLRERGIILPTPFQWLK